MSTEKQILDAMKKSGKPMSAGQVAEAANVDRKEVDKAMKLLKDSGKIVSPKRCYWEPAQQFYFLDFVNVSKGCN